jgi:hypothetical protein
MLLQNKEREEVINRGLHDLPHLRLGDVRILRVTVACGAVLPGMNVLDWAIAECQGHKRLGFSGMPRKVGGSTERLFHD